MKKIISIMLCLMIILTSVSACNKGDSNDDKKNTSKEEMNAKAINSPIEIGEFDSEKTPIEDDFSDKYKSFSNKLSKYYFKSDKNNENLVISPMSFYFAFSTLTEGSDQKTLTELLNLLNMDDVEFLRNNVSNYKKMLNQKDENGKIVISDSVWADKDFKEFIKKDYLEKVKNFHYSEVYSEKLNDQNTLSEMEKWVRIKTNNLIDPKIEADAASVLFILNTVYFKSDWREEFLTKKNDKDNFFLRDGKNVEVDYMNNSVENCGFAKNEDAMFSKLYFKNNYHIEFILPDEGKSIYDLVQDEKFMNYAFSNKKYDYYTVNWKIPLYNFKNEVDLKQMLDSMGIENIFNPNEANFSKMYEREKYGRNVYVSSARQLNNFILNNKGVEAASYTEVGMKTTAKPPEKEKLADMILNKPFMFILKDTLDNPVFVGIVGNPTK